MKTRHLLNTILLCFAFTIGFSSCNNENEPNITYQLKLSQTSCEIMQGNDVTISLTAHENTTIDIGNPELIHATYKWNINNNSFIKITAQKAGETHITVTDHETGASATVEVKVIEYPMPTLISDNSEGNIFELMSLHLTSEIPIVMDELVNVYDSLVWTVKGQEGSFKVFYHINEEDYHEESLTFEWGHCFQLPGNYETYLTAWKDNRIISSNQYNITIHNNKDFLNYNWEDITENSSNSQGYTDILGSNTEISTSFGLNNNIPFIKVSKIYDDLIPRHEDLYNLFSQLYGSPTYEEEIHGQDYMTELYNKLFSKQKSYPNDRPFAIWTTERANFVLLLHSTNWEAMYIIYAEPPL